MCEAKSRKIDNQLPIEASVCRPPHCVNVLICRVCIFGLGFSMNVYVFT